MPAEFQPRETNDTKSDNECGIFPGDDQYAYDITCETNPGAESESLPSGVESFDEQELIKVFKGFEAQPDGEFRYPIYRSPMAAQLRLLSRETISQGALNNRGLEIAWTNDPIGLFYLQIQGSGILEFDNGQRVNLSYAGSNEKPFKSLAKYMQSMGYLNGNLGRQAIQDWLAW